MSPLIMWALCVAALFLKIFGTSLFQGSQRIRHNAFAKPEDAKFFGKGAPARENELESVQRAQGALRNDGENIPIFLALSWAYVSLECWPVATPFYFGAFVLARVAHTVLMIAPRQPWRNFAYVTGLLVMLALTGHIVWAAIERVG